MKKILFVTSEAYPLVKTGGLADVSGGLPVALKQLGHDVRILIPGYAEALDSGVLQPLQLPGGHMSPALQHGILPGSDVAVYGLIQPDYFGREGNPYLGPDGKPWADNAQRFSLLCHVAVEIAMNRLGLDWKPEIVHCNDWQTGLVPALLNDEPQRPATVFTIHNLAYQGIFPHATFVQLRLPSRLWSHRALEFYDQLSFIKGGLVFADRVTTVSPTYAREIQGAEFGCGLDGLLRERNDRLSGILNGIDVDVWNPATDPHLPVHFDQSGIEKRAAVKSELQRSFGLPIEPRVPLLAWVGRLVEQKGIDLLLDIMPRLMALPLQIALVGSGDKRFEQSLLHWSKLFPDRLAVRLGYDEASARLIEGGSDVFLMPSRFEPCGLNQMYSQRYGAIPLVRRAGGLADTVVDACPETFADGSATGFVFNEATADAFFEAIERALSLYEQSDEWQTIQRNGMAKDFSWDKSAREYAALYDLAWRDRLAG
jgi:starch synthase